VQDAVERFDDVEPFRLDIRRAMDLELRRPSGSSIEYTSKLASERPETSRRSP
jgi:hypothetical protein